jgi:hypothetical protein
MMSDAGVDRQKVFSVCDHLVSQFGMDAVVARVVRGYMGHGDVASIHRAIREWLKERGPKRPDDAAPIVAGMSRIVELVSDYESLARDAAEAIAELEARNAEVESLLSQLDMYADENDVLRAHAARSERAAKRLSDGIKAVVERGPLPPLSQDGGPGVAAGDDPVAGSPEALARLVREAVGDVPLFAAGVQLESGDLVAADFLLPALAVELARFLPGESVRAALRRDKDAVLGWRLDAFEVPEGIDGAVRVTLLLSDDGSGEYSFDDAVDGFREWLAANGLPADEAADADVRIALAAL